MLIDELAPLLQSDVQAPDVLARLTWSLDADDPLVQAAQSGRKRRFARRLQQLGWPKARHLPRGVTAPAVQASWRFRPADSDAVEHLTRETLLAAGKSRAVVTNHVAALLDAADDVAELSPAVLGGWLTLIPAVGSRINRDLLWRLWQRTLVETGKRLSVVPESEADPVGTEAELQDELRFRAGLVFAPLAVAREWREAARRAWRARLAAGGEETWPQLGGTHLLDWVGSLVRTTSDAALFESALWKPRDIARLQRFARQMIATLTGDGTLAGPGGAAEQNLPLLETFGRLVGLEKECHELRLIRSLRRGRPTGRPVGKLRKSELPGVQSDVGRFALLRNHWGSRAAVCHFSFAAMDSEIDLSIAGERLLRGRWSSRVTLDGRPIPIEQPWRCECWFSDADVDFVELTTELEAGLTLMRQVCLTRDDQLVVLAEAVRGARADQQIELSSTLPLPPSLLPEVDGLTRELQIPLPSRRVRVFPVHLPWERSVAAEGWCRVGEEGLLHRIAGLGSRSQVLMLEWSRREADEPADASPLTVAEDLRRMTPAEACAGRLRVGTRQWLYLHNLTPGRVPRTVLGCHTESETIVGRVGSSGTVEYLVHVDGRSNEPEPAESSSAAG